MSFACPRNRVTCPTSPTPTCSCRSISRIDSTRSPPHSIRTGAHDCVEKTSTIPPRLATSPRSVTVPTFRYPARTKSSTNWSGSSTVPVSIRHKPFRIVSGSGCLALNTPSVTITSRGLGCTTNLANEPSHSASKSESGRTPSPPR